MQGIGDTTQARGDIGLRGVPDQVDGGDPERYADCFVASGTCG